MSALTSEVSEFITRARVGRLATADATGQPLVLPICYAFDGRVLYSAVDAKPKRRAADDLARVRNIRENPKVSLVIDEWILLEYACVFLPAQQNALVEQVSKAHAASPALLKSLGLAVDDSPELIPYCPLETLETSVYKAIERIDVIHVAEKAVADRIARRKGRV